MQGRALQTGAWPLRPRYRLVSRAEQRWDYPRFRRRTRARLLLLLAVLHDDESDDWRSFKCLLFADCVLEIIARWPLRRRPSLVGLLSFPLFSSRSLSNTLFLSSNVFFMDPDIDAAKARVSRLPSSPSVR